MAAVFLILTLIAGELEITFHLALFKYVGAACAFVGFALVIVAAGYVLVESLLTHRQLDAELLDIPELAEGTGQPSGDITTQGRRRHGIGPRGLFRWHGDRR